MNIKLDQMQSLRLMQDLDVKPLKAEEDIFDFDLKSVKLSSGQLIEAKSRYLRTCRTTLIPCIR